MAILNTGSKRIAITFMSVLAMVISTPLLAAPVTYMTMGNWATHDTTTWTLEITFEDTEMSSGTLNIADIDALTITTQHSQPFETATYTLDDATVVDGSLRFEDGAPGAPVIHDTAIIWALTFTSENQEFTYGDTSANGVAETWGPRNIANIRSGGDPSPTIAARSWTHTTQVVPLPTAATAGLAMLAMTAGWRATRRCRNTSPA